MAFYAKSLELYEIMNDVLLSLYQPTPDGSGVEDIHDFYFSNVGSDGERTVFELDRALTRWACHLPPHLRAHSFDELGDPIFCRQRIVLRARYVGDQRSEWPQT